MSKEEKKVIATDHHGNQIFEGRERAKDAAGEDLTDHYGRPVFEGQVEIKDAHGNRVYQEPWVGKGPKAGPDNPTGA
jgi:hypothetical protein